MAETRRTDARWLEPRRVLLALALVIAVTLLLVPWSADERTAALSSYSAAPSGARGLYEVMRRLGIDVDRRLVPMRAGLEAGATYAVLEPAIGFTAGEVHELLDAVRAGAGLLAVVPPASRLSDSLGIARAPELPPRDERRDNAAADSFVALRAGLVRYVLRRRTAESDSTLPFVVAQDEREFLATETRRGRQPVVVGFALGRGRIVVAANPDLFRNSLVRQGQPGVRAVRLFEWLDDGRGRTVVFDEYHHGYGAHADVVGATAQALADTPPGRALLHLAGAGLILLLALAVRPIRPSARTRIERRSPLEHVGALARAYAAARGQERATLLLVRGLRRRHGGPRATQDESTWLRAIGQRYAEVADQSERLVQALHEPSSASPHDVTHALLRIEEAMTR